MTTETRMVLAKQLIKELISAPCTDEMISDLEYCDFRTSVSKGCVRNGCFRATFIPSDFDFIIKVPRTMTDGGAFQCEREVEYYHAATRRGLSHYFATFYGSFDYGGRTFYVFEKIPNIGEGCDDYGYVVSQYAIKKGLLDFLNDYDISDLHFNNYGRKGRTYVLTDYAGCRSEDW